MIDSKELESETKSVMIGRKPRRKEGEFKTLSVALFEVNNPHKTGEFPTKVWEFPNVEKARVMGLNFSYYLEGNDIIINDLKKIKLVVDQNKILITGDQEYVEMREK